MEPNFGDNLMEGFRIISSDTRDGIAGLGELIFDSWSALSLFALGILWNSQPSKNPQSYWT
jgi:hypothetical protein